MLKNYTQLWLFCQQMFYIKLTYCPQVCYIIYVIIILRDITEKIMSYNSSDFEQRLKESIIIVICGYVDSSAA